MADDDTPTGGQPDENTGDTTPTGGEQDTSGSSHRDEHQRTEPSKEQPAKTFTQDELDRLLTDRLARERKKFADYDALRKKAGEYDKLQDAQKSELEKLNDQLTAAQVELQGFKVAEIRRSAVEEAGLPPGMAEFITAADHDAAVEQAKKLLNSIKPAQEKRGTDLKQGTRTPPPKEQSRDELIRGLAGYGT